MKLAYLMTISLLVLGITVHPEITIAQAGNDQRVPTVDKSNLLWKQSLKKPELMDFKRGDKYYWDLETNVGEISFQLFAQTAPMHVTSTIYLTELGFYDDVVDRLHNFITAHVKSVVTSDGDDCQLNTG